MVAAVPAPWFRAFPSPISEVHLAIPVHRIDVGQADDPDGVAAGQADGAAHVAAAVREIAIVPGLVHFLVDNRKGRPGRPGRSVCAPGIDPLDVGARELAKGDHASSSATRSARRSMSASP